MSYGGDRTLLSGRFGHCGGRSVAALAVRLDRLLSVSISQLPEYSIWHASSKGSQFRLAECLEPRLPRFIASRHTVPFAFPLNRFAAAIPFLLVTVQHATLPDHGLQQLRRASVKPRWPS